MSENIENAGCTAESTAARRGRLCKPWPKGRSGNPRGKRPGTASLRAAIRRGLTRERADAIAKRLLSSASKGSLKAIELIMRHVEAAEARQALVQVSVGTAPPAPPAISAAEARAILARRFLDFVPADRRAEVRQLIAGGSDPSFVETDLRAPIKQDAVSLPGNANAEPGDLHDRRFHAATADPGQGGA